MKEGKLSSALQERYKINKRNAVGKVLWHSLNESAQIGVYDMKFGNTIVRNLLTEDIGYRIDNIPVNSMIEEMAEMIVEFKQI